MFQIFDKQSMRRAWYMEIQTLAFSRHCHEIQESFESILSTDLHLASLAPRSTCRTIWRHLWRKLRCKKTWGFRGRSSMRSVPLSSPWIRAVLMISNTIYQFQNSVEVIMYSARWLNFNLSLSSFDLSVRGTRNMIKFAHETVHVSRLKFILTWRNYFGYVFRHWR